MYSAKNESRVRPQTMFAMNNTVIGNCSPHFLVPEPPAIRVQRMVEMETELATLSAKKNPNNRKVPASARKFTTAKKPLGLSQNMSTSKKLTNSKRASNIGAKRSINFSTYIQNEYPHLPYKSASRPSVAPKTDKKKLVNNSFAVSTERFSISSADEKKCGNSILKKTPKSAKKPERKNVQSPSDIEISPYPYLYNNPPIFITTQEVSNTNNSDALNDSVNDELKGLVENNSKILTELMRLLTNLLENNNKLNDLIDKNKTQREVSKAKEATVFKELFPLQIDGDKENSTNVEYYAKPNSLRKAAILNSEYKKNATVSIVSPKKKSLQMYAELKSNMKFLNTPRKDGDHYSIESQTPNTRGRAMLSANIQDQLKLLYDSPTD